MNIVLVSLTIFILMEILPSDGSKFVHKLNVFHKTEYLNSIFSLNFVPLRLLTLQK